MKTIRFKHDRAAGAHRRSGLAPLEMVLLTPLLVLMGALMICFGDAALWKIRAQTAVHYAATQTESFRAVNFAGFSANPRPASWPEPAAIGGGGGANVSSVQDLFWNQTGPEDVAALQGNVGNGTPTNLVDPYLGNQTPVKRKFIADRGVHAGTASLTKQFPMLTRLLPSGGTYRVDLHSEYLEGDWYFQNLGLGGNRQRRAGALYVIDPDRHPGVIGLWQRFMADYRKLGTVDRAIDYLDNDGEIFLYQPWRTRPIDFHPSRPSGCELDLMTYANSSQFQRHLRQIRNVPRNMAMTWRGVYQTELRNREDPDYVDKGPFSDDELQDRIDTLTDYLTRLRAAGY